MDVSSVHDRRWWALAVMCLSLLVIGLDNTILNVALPALVRDVHASTSSLQWIVDGYTLVFAGLLLTTGSLGDRFGRKGALSTGLAIFCVGSAASAFAGSADALIFTRAFMGIGAALIMPATLSLLTNIFSDPKERGRAIGVWAAVAGAGGAIGPVLGGFLLQHFWWGSVFLVNVPVTLVALVAGRVLLPSSKDPSAPRLDPIGALLSIAGLVALLWAIIEAPTKGWNSSSVVIGLIAGVGVLAGFVLWEITCDHPMLDVRFFKNRRFSGANAAITMVFFAMFGASFLITQYLQTVLGFSALEAGLRMLPMAIVLLLVAPISPRFVERIGTKLVVGTGLLLAAAGLILVSTVPIADGYPHLLAGMLVLAVGMGLVMAPATESIMGSLPPNKAGVGSAMNDTTRQMGGALGVAVIGSVLASSYRPAVADRLTAMHAPSDVVNAARDSIGGAIDAAGSLAEPMRTNVIGAARLEFVNSFGGALMVGALILLVAAAVAFAFLPARAGDAREPVEGALDGIASLTFAEAEGQLEEDAETAQVAEVGASHAAAATEPAYAESSAP
jgi:EmrB/QacA subfamily drug resistance transporter